LIWSGNNIYFTSKMLFIKKIIQCSHYIHTTNESSILTIHCKFLAVYFNLFWHITKENKALISTLKSATHTSWTKIIRESHETRSCMNKFESWLRNKTQDTSLSKKKKTQDTRLIVTSI
jgi:hemerythrin-like domain-containing protein